VSKDVLLLLTLCLVGGIYQNHERIGRWLNPPSESERAAMSGVVMYATSWCGACAAAREFMAQQGVRYREIDIEKSDEGRREYQKLGAHGVPILVVNDTTVLHGFNPDALRTALAR